MCRSETYTEYVCRYVRLTGGELLTCHVRAPHISQSEMTNNQSYTSVIRINDKILLHRLPIQNIFQWSTKGICTFKNYFNGRDRLD